MEPTKEQKKVLKRLQEVDPDLVCQWHPELKIPTRLRGKLSAPARGNPVAIARQFLADYRALYGIKDVDRELELKTAKRDKKEGTHIRLRQRWQNIPVFSTELIVHVGPDNMIKGINGEFHPIVDIPTEPKISADEAIAVAKKHAGKASDIPGQTPKLEIFHKKGEYKLCWHVKFDGVDGDKPALWEYFIDAERAKVVFRYNNLHFHTATSGYGRGRYAGCVSLNTYHNHSQTTYQLRDTTRSGIEVRTYDMAGSTNRDSLTLSEDTNNRWTSINRNPRHDSQEPEADCHYYLGKVVDYYLNVHGRSSYDDAGSDAEVCVHYGNNDLGSFWDTIRHRIYHGDGDGVNRDYKSSLDVNAHEFTHGVTEAEVNFNYWGQSGSLCEAFSDFFACMIQTDWIFEEEIFLGATAPNDALRSLYDPTLYGHPDHMNNIGASMHDNSCIVSKAGYLMTHGGTHNGIEVYGLDRSITEQIWYQSLQHLTSSSQFADFRHALEEACDDLYP
ncbi:MAG: M4 family metallopeptidase, partial [Planctomycetota bacterium]